MKKLYLILVLSVVMYAQLKVIPNIVRRPGFTTSVTAISGTGCVPAGSSGQLVTDDGAGACTSNATAAGVLTFLGTPSSANLAAAVTNETGSGLLVFATSPVFTTPNLGVPSAVTLTNATSLRGNAMAAAAGDATIGQVIAHGATALDFASTATGACSTVITATATGAASTDVIQFTPNASIKAVTGYVPASTGGGSIGAYPTANTANFEWCNWTSGTVDPGSITVNWIIIR